MRAVREGDHALFGPLHRSAVCRFNYSNTCVRVLLLVADIFEGSRKRSGEYQALVCVFNNLIILVEHNQTSLMVACHSPVCSMCP